mmetsp:Transcript_30903/g.106863  ORF Transcript_30903/g.106863 Transcript_30903/m.106863 type:complete len:274 (-) Transcript_30903:3369-4190(-)
MIHRRAGAFTDVRERASSRAQRRRPRGRRVDEAGALPGRASGRWLPAESSARRASARRALRRRRGRRRRLGRGARRRRRLGRGFRRRRRGARRRRYPLLGRRRLGLFRWRRRRPRPRRWRRLEKSPRPRVPKGQRRRLRRRWDVVFWRRGAGQPESRLLRRVGARDQKPPLFNRRVALVAPNRRAQDELLFVLVRARRWCCRAVGAVSRAVGAVSRAVGAVSGAEDGSRPGRGLDELDSGAVELCGARDKLLRGALVAALCVFFGVKEHEAAL